MSRIPLALLALILSLVTAPAWPLASDRNQPIHIESDRLEIDEGKRQSDYSGHVVMQQGSLHIEADRIRFIFDANNDLLRLDIEGQPARFRQTGDDGQPLSGQARTIVYHNRKALLELNGDARLQTGKDRIESQRIRYNIDSSALEAGDSQTPGKGRVRMVIQPRTADDAPPATRPAAQP